MVFVRRLLSAILLLALTHFGVLATAPAHAHAASEAAHTAFAVELYDHAYAAHGHHHHHGAAELDADQDADRDGDDRADVTDGESDSDGSNTVIHVHSCPQLAPAGLAAEPSGACGVAARLQPVETFALNARTSAPPFRPPRAL